MHLLIHLTSLSLVNESNIELMLVAVSDHLIPDYPSDPRLFHILNLIICTLWPLIYEILCMNNFAVLLDFFSCELRFIINNILLNSSQKECWLLAYKSYLFPILMQIIQSIIDSINKNFPFLNGIKSH
jgi:hypothetical protein